ncbi:unnamed protein product [Paramecium primaurelia]|uniref:Uncharacterized protein n=1 Tax=Paramecium primaurelia TaxID=5886 RepID=A0A8S1MTV7_PARPR|nr:unnamed protein product [Paramecium primaurelia]
MLWIIFLFNITFEQSLFYSAYEDSTLTIQDNWQFFGNTTTDIISTCGSSSIIGGYNLFSNGVAATLFIDLQPHYKMKISFSLFIIDTWDNEYFYLYADQDLVFTQKYSNINGQGEICGQPGSNRKDQIHQIEIEFDHTGLTSFIQLTSNLNDSADDESWGFRNFRIYIFECPPQCYVCSKVDQQLQCEKWIRAYSIFTQLLENEFQENTLISVINGETTKQLCSQIPIMCGYGVCGRDTIIQMNNLQLPFHTRIKIKLKYLIIDSWESTDYAKILVDGVLRWTSELSLTNQNLYRVCGGGSKGIFVNLELTFPHIQTSTTIQILNTLNQDFLDESFGLRDLTIYTQQSNCGDQIIQENEECDDGNLVPFDGCFSCLYSCVDGCEICEKGNCLRCGQGWILQRQIQKCQRIDIQSKVKEDKCTDQQNDIEMNQIRRDCEIMDYSSLVVFEEEILNKCQPQCKICIQSKIYKNKNLYVILIVKIVEMVYVMNVTKHFQYQIINVQVFVEIKLFNQMKNVMMVIMQNLMVVIIVDIHVLKIVVFVKTEFVQINVNKAIILLIILVKLYVEILSQLDLNNVKMKIIFNMMDVINVDILVLYFVMIVQMDNVIIVIKVLFSLKIFVQMFVVMDYFPFKRNVMMVIKLMVMVVQKNVNQKLIGFVIKMEIVHMLSILFPLLNIINKKINFNMSK